METRREEGTVVGLAGGTARVRLARRGTCGGCRACAALGPGEMALEARNLAGAGIGDRVVVEVAGPGHLRAVVLAYGAPLAAFVAACAAGAAVTGSDAAGFGVGAAAFLGACLILKLYDRKMRRSGAASATVVERRTEGWKSGNGCEG